MTTPSRLRRVLTTVAVLIMVAGCAGEPAPVPDRPSLVVVGAAGRGELRAVDARALDTAGSAQVAGLRPTEDPTGCRLSSWASLGAGREVRVDGRCRAEVNAYGVVTDWARWQSGAAGSLGTLNDGLGSGSAAGGCVSSVGEGAAVAAARADGTTTDHRGSADWVASGMPLGCSVTLVDAGPDTDRVIAAMTERAEVTLVVVGTDPRGPSGSSPWQLAYRLGGEPAGLLGAGLDRGRLEWADVTRSVQEFGGTGTVGRPLEVAARPVDSRVAADHLADLQVGLPTWVWLAGGALALLALVGVVRRVRRPADEG